MRVKIMPFEWELAEAVPLDNLMDHLRQKGGEKVEFGDHARRLYVCDLDDYWGGMLMTIKDQKHLPLVAENNGKIVITVSELEKGTSPFEFNFFVIVKKTRRGLYQHYHQSCSVGQFSSLCRLAYDELRQQGLTAAKNKLATGASKKEVKAIEKKYRPSLKYVPIYRQETLNEILKDLDRIKSFEFDFATLTVDGNGFTPLRDAVKKESHTLRFKKDWSVASIRDQLVSIIESKRLTKGRIEGRDSSGLEQVVRLTNNPDVLAEADYDDLAKTIEIDLGKIKEAHCLQVLLKVAGSKENHARMHKPSHS
ncbi:MAG: hypothetical protein IT446_14885 [Phycisphaerales bacterium]|nr:hypothetical protein [Phycisphaerales bacterium]